MHDPVSPTLRDIMSKRYVREYNYSLEDKRPISETKYWVTGYNLMLHGYFVTACEQYLKDFEND